MASPTDSYNTNTSSRNPPSIEMEKKSLHERTNFAALPYELRQQIYFEALEENPNTELYRLGLMRADPQVNREAAKAASCAIQVTMRKFQTDHALAQADGDDAWLTRNIIRRRFHAGILTSAQVEALTVTQQAAPAKASAKESSAIRSLERLESRSRRLEKTAARQPTDARPPHVDEDESIPLALGIP